MKTSRRSIRIPGYDYASAGWFFVTILCHKRKHLFGEFREGEMVLNESREIAQKCWMEIPEHFPDVYLHDHVVMPNHIHGIIELTVRAENFLTILPRKSIWPNERENAKTTRPGHTKMCPCQEWKLRILLQTAGWYRKSYAGSIRRIS